MKYSFMFSYSANSAKGSINGNIVITNKNSRFSEKDMDDVRRLIEKTGPDITPNTVVINFIYMFRDDE